MGRNDVPVVITRKHKRINRVGHALAFALTGGLSGVYTAGRAAANVGYNAETERLAGTAPKTRKQSDLAAFRADHVPGSREYKAKHG